MADKTYYSLLEVSETASAAEIRTAYRRLMRDVHPDRLANAPAYWQRQAEEKAKEINQAFAVLSNPEMRRGYDAALKSNRRSNPEAAYRPTTQAPNRPERQENNTSSSAHTKTATGPAQSFKSRLTPRDRFLGALVLIMFGFGAASNFWDSTSPGEEVVFFVLAGGMLFGSACLFQRQISRFLSVVRIRKPRQQLFSIVGSILMLLWAGRLLSDSQSRRVAHKETYPAVQPTAAPASPRLQSTGTGVRTPPLATWVVPVGLPNGTEIIRRRRTGGYGKFTVDNGTSNDAVVELVDSRTGRAIRAFYVESGRQFTEDRIAPGAYRIYYTTGDDWNGATKMFNRESELGVFDEIASFAEQRNEATGEIDFHVFSVTLQPVVGGTARTSNLAPDDFKNAMIASDPH